MMSIINGQTKEDYGYVPTMSYEEIIEKAKGNFVLFLNGCDIQDIVKHLGKLPYSDVSDLISKIRGKGIALTKFEQIKGE